jgi:hypothetical protein
MPEVLERICNLLKNAKIVGLFSKKSADDYNLLAKEALRETLAEKKITTLSFPEETNFQKEWDLIIDKSFDNQILPQQTSIRIPKNYKIKELGCEEDDNFLSLVITSENGGLDKNALIFEPVLPKLDAAFCFFGPEETDYLKEFEEKAALPEKEKIIFITSSEIFSQKIFQIIQAFNREALTLSSIPTLLLASLIRETDFFANADEKIIAFSNELISYGAEMKTINEIIEGKKSASSAQLLGRALTRTYDDKDLDTIWTFLSEKDFIKTGGLSPSPQFLYNDVIKKICNFIPKRTFSLLFWQDNKKIFALAAGGDEKKLLPLAECLGAGLKSKFFTVGPFDNFSEAELKLRKALKEIKSPTL